MNLFVLILLLFEVQWSIQASAPVIQIASGKIKGEEKESRDDKKFFAYRGIPYATAKRFEAPLLPANWSTVFDAEDYGKECMQYSTFEKKVVGAEECHFINVFTPKVDNGLSKLRLLPVMVFIHGSFMEGTSEIYRAHYFMDATEGVVIVTFNYRTNVFGFLSTGDEVLPGNLGLKDQIAALKWVKANIRKFYGDPNRVTVFGFGDGATSVHLLQLSPLSKGLFRKAITQSGSAHQLNVIQTTPKVAAQRIARLMKCEKVMKGEKTNATSSDSIEGERCHYDNSTWVMECLKKVEPKKLAEIQKDAFNLDAHPLSWFGPVVESSSKDLTNDPPFLTEHPYSIISTGRQLRVPWMTGFSSEEGLLKTGVILNNPEFMTTFESNFDTIAPKLLKYSSTRSDVTRSIRKFYLGPKIQETTNQTISASANATLYPTLPPLTINNYTSPATESSLDFNEELPTLNFEEQLMSFTQLFTDRLIAHGMFEAVKIQAKYSPVYFYYNNYEGQYTLLDVYTGKSKEPTPAIKKVSSWFKQKILGRAQEVPKQLGVCHGDELPLLFKYPDLKIKENARDYQMSKNLINLWVQFAADETRMTFQNTTWLPVAEPDLVRNDFFVMKLGEHGGFEKMSSAFMNRMKFWNGLNYVAPFQQ